MSLTSHLSQPGSPVQAFMQQRFSASSGFVRRHNAELSRLHTLRPRSSNAPYSLLGTAIDYRIRYYFEGALNQVLVAQHGAMLLSPGQPLDLGNLMAGEPGADPGPVPYRTLEASCVSDFFRSLADLVARLPWGQVLERDDEEMLCRYCVVLAYFDQAVRAGPQRLADSPLLRDHRPSVDKLLSVAERDWVEDLAAQSRLFHEGAAGRLTEPCRLNPTFEGSNDVGGADADLILGSALIDIKATVNPKIGRPWLWQLLGYALLDYSDQYGIDTVGVYLSRQGHFLEWPIEALVEEIASQPTSWDTARADFRQTAAAARVLDMDQRTTD